MNIDLMSIEETYHESDIGHIRKRLRQYPKYGGLQWGPYARSAGLHMEQDGIKDESLAAARHHGANVARVAAALKGAELFE